MGDEHQEKKTLSSRLQLKQKRNSSTNYNNMNKMFGLDQF